MVICPTCSKGLSGPPVRCPHCGFSLPLLVNQAAAGAQPAPSRPGGAPGAGLELWAATVAGKPRPAAGAAFLRRLGWLSLSLLALVVTVGVLSAGTGLRFAPLVVLLGFAAALLSVPLLGSLAATAHRLRFVKPGAGGREAGLQALVAAHEVAHIASGDMVTMALVQGAVTCTVYPLQWGLTLVAWGLESGSDDLLDWMLCMLLWELCWLVSDAVMVLGTLVVRAFSRQRELAADALAAQLVGREAVVHALQQLEADGSSPPLPQRAYAAFKAKPAGTGYDSSFSTHPSTRTRCWRLEPVGARGISTTGGGKD